MYHESAHDHKLTCSSGTEKSHLSDIISRPLIVFAARLPDRHHMPVGLALHAPREMREKEREN
jgi:fibrillarin-like rRNA methylase